MPRIPDVRDVQQVGAARDPGVNAPLAAFGAAESAGIADLGSRVAQVADRAMTRHESIRNGQSVEQFDNDTYEDFLKTSTEDDFSRDEVKQAFGQRLAERRAAMIQAAGGRADAQAWLEETLSDRSSRYTGLAAASAREAVVARSEKQINNLVSPLEREAAQNPGRLDDLIKQADRVVSGFAPSFTPGQETAVTEVVRDRIARATIDAHLAIGDVDEAEEAFDMVVASGLLMPETQAKFQRQIRETRFADQETERQLAKAEMLMGRSLTGAERAQVGLASLGLSSSGASEPLEVIADETSPTGTRFVPRSQAAGMPAPAKTPLVDMGTQVGTIPAGFQAIKDPASGALRMEPIPGGPADIEAQRAEIRSTAAGEDEASRARSTVRSIDIAQELIKKGAGGPAASVTAHLPWTDSFQLDRQLDAVKARVTIQTLQEIRAASPTGGALGSVSDREGVKLESARGSLDVRQDPPILAETLNEIRELQLDAWYGTPAEHERAIDNGDMTEEEAAKLQRERQTVGFDAIGKPEGEGGEPGTAQAGETPEAAPPPGVTPDEWQYMTPEERALWEGEDTDDSEFEELLNRYAP